MGNKPIISVIVPVYNGEKYIAECISSLIEQTMRSIEIIIINDGSQDCTGEICKNFAKADSRIVYVEQANIGVSKTRKKGIDIAKGQLLFLIDSDDFLEKNCLERLYQVQVQSNADIVCCGSMDFGEGMQPQTHSYEEQCIVDKECLLAEYFSNTRHAYVLWGKLYKKQLFNGLDFPVMKYAEDTYLTLVLYQKCKGVFLSDFVGYYYRIHSNSATYKLDVLQKANDILTRDKLVCDICEKLQSALLENAYCRLESSMNAAIYEHIFWAEKEALKNFHQRFREYYSILKKKHKIWGEKRQWTFFLFSTNARIFKLIYCIFEKHEDT